jgi:hypothetical protein
MIPLRDRITADFRNGREWSRKRYAERDRVWSNGLTRLEHQDELDERHIMGQTPRSSMNAQRRGIERYFKLKCDADAAAMPPKTRKVIEDAYGEPFGQIVYNASDKHNINAYYTKLAKSIIRNQPQQRIAGNRQDVRDNYLYQEWKQQIGKKDAIRTYPVYALFVAIKAVLNLLTTRPNGDELFQKFHRGTLLQREALLRWKESELFDPNDPVYILSRGLAIPGMLGAAESLIIHYSDFVRAERSRLDSKQTDVLPSPPPDDPEGDTLSTRYEIPFDVRMENAIQGYLAKEGSADVVAKRYGIPQKQFRAELRNRNHLSTRGGDRKGKKV